jgi:RNase P subunit RPR2
MTAKPYRPPDLYVRACKRCHDLTAHTRTKDGDVLIYICCNCGATHRREPKA